MKNLFAGLIGNRKEESSGKKLDEKKELKLGMDRPSSPLTLNRSSVPRNFTNSSSQPSTPETKKKSFFSKSPVRHSSVDSTSDAPWQGWLLKRNKTWAGWKKKWFYLDTTNILYYYRTKDDSDEIGSYELFGAFIEEIGLLDDQMEAYTKLKEDQLKQNSYKATPRGQFKERDDIYKIAIITYLSNQKGKTVENRVTILDCSSDETRKSFMSAYKTLLESFVLPGNYQGSLKNPPDDTQIVEKSKKKFSLFKEHVPDILDNTPPLRFEQYPFCGWLLKPNSMWVGWKKKWFVLTPHNSLVYYRTKESHDEIGSYDLTTSYVEEICIVNDDLTHYRKTKEEQLKNGTYTVTQKGEYKELVDLYRIAILAPSAIQKGVLVENRVTVLDCVTNTSRQLFLDSYKKLIASPNTKIPLEDSKLIKSGKGLGNKNVTGLTETKGHLFQETRLSKLLHRSEVGGSISKDEFTKDLFSGFLQKKNKHWNGWKKKWFVLSKDLTLSYYRKENSLEEAVGVYELKQAHLEEISVADSDIEAYSKKKEEEIKGNKYKLTSKSTFKEKEDVYRIGIITSSSFQKGVTIENRVTVIDCGTAENRKAIMDPWRKYMNSEKKKKDDENNEKEHRHEQVYCFHHLELYQPFYKWLVDTNPEDVILFFDGLDINLINDFEITALLGIYESSSLGSIALVKAAMTVEINQTFSPETMFRRNSITSKLVTSFIRKYGMSYIADVIKEDLKDICLQNKLHEIDPMKIKFEGDKTPIQQENGKALSILGELIMQKLYGSKNDFPLPLKILLAHSKDIAEIKFPGTGLTIVGAVFFLRLLCPAFVTPDTFGILPSKPPPNASRSLILLTKAFLNIANKVGVTKKELYMDVMADFSERNIPPAFEFLEAISTLDDQSSENKDPIRLEITYLQCLHGLCRKSIISAGFGEIKSLHALHVFKSIGILSPKATELIKEDGWDESFALFGEIVQNISDFKNCNNFTSLNVLEPLCRYVLIPNLSHALSFGLENTNAWEVLVKTFSEESEDFDDEIHTLIRKFDIMEVHNDKIDETKFSIFVCKAINEKLLTTALSAWYDKVSKQDIDLTALDVKMYLFPSIFVYINFIKDLQFDLHLSTEVRANTPLDKELPKVVKVIDVESFDLNDEFPEYSPELPPVTGP